MYLIYTLGKINNEDESLHREVHQSIWTPTAQSSGLFGWTKQKGYLTLREFPSFQCSSHACHPLWTDTSHSCSIEQVKTSHSQSCFKLIWEEKPLALQTRLEQTYLFLHGSSLLKARVERRNKPILECLNQKSVIFFSISKSSSVWVTNILVDHHNISTVWWSIPSAHHSMEICFKKKRQPSKPLKYNIIIMLIMRSEWQVSCYATYLPPSA